MLIYEKRIGSVNSLKRQLSQMDGDAGVRIVGKYRAKKCLAFVTRFHERYTMVVCLAKGKPVLTPGKVISSREYDGISGLFADLKPIAGQRVQAYAY